MHSGNNELVKAGHDFAAAISNDTPIIEITKMVANLATALDDRTREVTAYESTVTNLEAALSTATESLADAHHVLRVETEKSNLLSEQAQGLAAENAGLKGVVSEINNELYGQGFQVSGWHLNGELEPLDNWFTDNGWGEPKTTDTDAALTEMRNSFVDEAVTAMVSSGAQTFGDCIVAVNGLRKEQGK